MGNLETIYRFNNLSRIIKYIEFVSLRVLIAYIVLTVKLVNPSKSTIFIPVVVERVMFDIAPQNNDN